jgi:hypothetical protein
MGRGRSSENDCDEHKMSIYATLWSLKFPKLGQDYFGCEWVEVIAQAVPPHIGSPTPGCGYEDGDPYGAFLPPSVRTDDEGEAEYMRAVVFVAAGTKKGTARSPQEYIDPLFVLTGEQYAKITFEELHNRICDALRGNRPRLCGSSPFARRRVEGPLQ